jgi:AraC-like DNA-binding protein
MAKIALDTVKSLLNHLTLKGLDREQMLVTVGLSEQQLNQSDLLLDTSLYESLYQLAQTQLASQTVGFEFGQTIEPDRWGILGYIAFTAPTLAAALANQRKYQTLVGDMGTPLQAFTEHTMILKWMPSYHCSFHTVEDIITGWVVMAKKLSNHQVKPSAVYFNHACHSDAQLYQQVFGCEVHFDSDFNGVEIEQPLLDTPLSKHNPELYQLLCQQAAKMIDNLVEKVPVEVITQFISNQLPSGVPEIEDAAQNLQMSVRTLQRKLSEHQLTFSGLIDAIRQELACSYLRHTNTKVVYIAQMLGFSEQSALQRAFKRWTGQTPKQFRANAQSGY